MLHAVRNRISLLADTDRVAAAYGIVPGTKPVPRLTFLSPLAEGADRLAARAALSEGFDLFVPMPFPLWEYRKDFTAPGSDQDFDDILSQGNAGVLELDGQRPVAPFQSIHEARSYEAVGHFVVDNCDLLIAIWDGEASRGWGGTAEMVRHAAAGGPPVWWIHATKAELPRWVTHFRDVHAEPSRADADEALIEYLTALFVPPAVDDSHSHHGLIDSVIHWWRGAPIDPMTTYFHDALPRQQAGMHTTKQGDDPLPAVQPPWILRRHTGLLRLLSAQPWRSWRHCDRAGLMQKINNQARKSPSAPEHMDPWVGPRDYWRRHYAFADERAEASGQRYRSVYVWIFLIIAASLIAATGALATPPNATWHLRAELAAIGIEVVGLGFILALLVANSWHDWHQRWIDCRLLAELCRGQRSVARLGWTLPGRMVAGLAGDLLADEKHKPFPQGLLTQTKRLMVRLWR